MLWKLKIGKSSLTLHALENTVAILPSTDRRTQFKGRTDKDLVASFGKIPPDDSVPGTQGLANPIAYKEVFKKRGWHFIEPNDTVRDTASQLRSVPDTEAVSAVYLDEAGNLLLGTRMVSIQMDPSLTPIEAQQQLQKHEAIIVNEFKFKKGLYQVKIREGTPLEDQIDQLQSDNEYEFAEPSFIQVLNGRHIPNDPLFPLQWQHKNNGIGGGIAGADIKTPAAWNHTKGAGPNGPVRIAIIDNGMFVNHADLKPGIIFGGYFLDTEEGEAIFVPYQPGDQGFPSHQHGTFCMGMAGARMDNNKGVCGSAPESHLIPIACLPDQIGSQETLARAIAYAANPSFENPLAIPNDGADIISCSLGPGNGSHWNIRSPLQSAIDYAVNQGRGGLGCPLFWSVSNGSHPIVNDEVCSHPNVIAIGRSNRMDFKDGSAFGPELDFLAPGRLVYSTTPPHKYTWGTGTSYATPLAAGVGGLILSINPDLTRDQVRTILQETCDEIGGVQYTPTHVDYGHGRINAQKAVQRALQTLNPT